MVRAKGLKAEAGSSLKPSTQLDPRREAAWKKLGYVKHDGRWMTPAQQAADESRNRRPAQGRRPLAAAASEMEDRTGPEKPGAPRPRRPWRPSTTPARPLIWTVFGLGSAEDQERAIDMLGHIEGDRPSRSLAALAIFGKTDLVRRAAVETVTRRKADDVMIAWIGLLQPPIKYEVTPGGRAGLAGRPVRGRGPVQFPAILHAADRPADAAAVHQRANTRELVSSNPVRLAATQGLGSARRVQVRRCDWRYVALYL